MTSEAPIQKQKKNSFQTDHPPLDLLTNLPKGCDLMTVSKVTSSYLSYKSYIALLGLQVVWLTFPLRSALMPSLTWTFPLTLPLCSLQHCHLFLLTVLPGSVTYDPRGKHVPRVYSPTYHLLPTHLYHHYTDIKITFPSLCPGARLQISSDSQTSPHRCTTRHKSQEQCMDFITFFCLPAEAPEWSLLQSWHFHCRNPLWLV